MTKWIDVSDFSVWKGHLTGIQRVTFNLGKRLAEQEDVRYFKYEPSKRIFFEVDFNFKDFINDNQPEAISREQRLKNVVAGRIPKKLVNRLSPRQKNMIKKTAHLSIATARSVIHRARPISRQEILPANFNSNDTVFVLGNAWDHSGLMGDLGIVKAKMGIKIVNVVYDLIPIFQPHLFGNMLTKQYVDYMFESIACSDLLLAISENTKKDVKKYCDDIEAACPPTEVIRLGDDLPESIEQKPVNNVDKNYILCVGTVETRKNHTLLYYAYKLLVERDLNLPQLVIAGKIGWYVSDILMLIKNDPAVNNKIRIIDNTTDEQLEWLYSHCLFTIYPSVYEGWGLPVGESLLRGKVCLASSASSVPEVGRDCADYFHPADSSECANLIEKYLDEGTRKAREAFIVENYKSTTWHDTFSQMNKYVTEWIQ